MKTEVVVVIGAGGIGMAIARRQGFGKHILLADFNETLLAAAVKELEVASYKVSWLKVDVSSRESVRTLADKAASLGTVINVVNTAGVSPNMAPADRILAVDLYGSAVVFEEFERVIAQGGSALVVSSLAGYMSPALPKEQDHALAFTPADDLFKLPFLSAKRFRIQWLRTSSPSARTTCVYWPPASVGASMARASIPSAMESFRLRSMIYSTKLLLTIPGLRLIGTAREKASVLSFVLDGFRTEEVGAALNREGIAVRSGHHCAQPALRRFGVETSVRPSLALYNNDADVDALIAVLRKLKNVRALAGVQR